jgi:hypothetical protein
MNAAETQSSPLTQEPDDPLTTFPSLQDFVLVERLIQTNASTEDINFFLWNMHNGFFAEKALAISNSRTRLSFANVSTSRHLCTTPCVIY